MDVGSTTGWNSVEITDNMREAWKTIGGELSGLHAWDALPKQGFGQASHTFDICSGRSSRLYLRLFFDKQSTEGKINIAPKWRNRQTRYVQGVVTVRSCGFKSHLRHHGKPGNMARLVWLEGI